MLNIKEMSRLRKLIDDSDFKPGEEDGIYDIRSKLSDMIMIKKAWNAKIDISTCTHLDTIYTREAGQDGSY